MMTSNICKWQLATDGVRVAALSGNRGGESSRMVGGGCIRRADHGVGGGVNPRWLEISRTKGRLAGEDAASCPMSWIKCFHLSSLLGAKSLLNLQSANCGNVTLMQKQCRRTVSVAGASWLRGENVVHKAPR